MSLADRHLSHRLAAKYGTGGRLGWQSAVYAKQIEWAEKEGYENCNALYEVYVTSPSEVLQESDFITEVYYPVKKILKK